MCFVSVCVRACVRVSVCIGKGMFGGRTWYLTFSLLLLTRGVQAGEPSAMGVSSSTLVSGSGPSSCSSYSQQRRQAAHSAHSLSFGSAQLELWV